MNPRVPIHRKGLSSRHLLKSCMDTVAFRTLHSQGRSLALMATLAAQLTGPAGAPAAACSRILINSQGQSAVGRTMDLYISDRARIVVYPRGIARDGGVAGARSARWTSRYGSVTVNSLGLTSSDGINEKGLVANLLYLHNTQYEASDGRPVIANTMAVQYLLDQSATVTEALANLQKHRVASIKAAGREWPLHISVSDASGDSAVIEFVNGKQVVHHGRDIVAMTNEPALDWQLQNLKRYRYFGGQLSLPGDIDPASRFVRISAFAKTTPPPPSAEKALEAAYSIIKSVSVAFGAIDTSVSDGGQASTDTWPTRWTSLADSVKRRYFFQAAESPNLFWIDLQKLNFAQGQPVRALATDDTSLSGEVSRLLTVERR